MIFPVSSDMKHDVVQLQAQAFVKIRSLDAFKNRNRLYFVMSDSPIRLLYLVTGLVQDFVQQALFSETQAIRSGWGNYV